MKNFTNDPDKIPAIIAGILVGGLMVIGTVSSNYTNTNYSGLRRSTPNLLNNNTPEIKPQNSVNGRISDRTQVLMRSEDEYWEVECIGDVYYMVRREDWEEIEGGDGTQEERRIGSIKDLNEYAKGKQGI